MRLRLCVRAGVDVTVLCLLTVRIPAALAARAQREPRGTAQRRAGRRGGVRLRGAQGRLHGDADHVLHRVSGTRHNTRDVICCLYDHDTQ